MNRYYLLLRSFVVCLCIVAGHALQAQVIYVTPNGAGDQSGSNWANAAPGSQLQNKMDAAWDGSEIWVSKGTYYPTSYPANSVFTGSYSPSARNYSFYLKSGVTMYGGFAGGETNLGLRNLLYNPTVLSGDIGVAGNSADNCFHVVVSLGGNNATALDGFIIRDGNANLNSFGSHTVSGATVSSDIAPGILLINSAAKFRNCEISNTSSLSFGAVYNNDYSSTVFTNCIFLDNSAGIGTISNSGTISLINCLLFGNTTQYTAVNYGNASFTNCNIIYNTGTGFVNFTGSATLSNCVIWGKYQII
ncbi:MAG: right-handed parallel beta-helix repeat-containing protein [Bacteroidota bacterium]